MTLTLALRIPGAFLAGVSAYLAMNAMDGWGWFLFAAVLLL